MGAENQQINSVSQRKFKNQQCDVEFFLLFLNIITLNATVRTYVY